MKEITIKKAGIIYIALVLVIFVGYYYSLSSQDEFIRDNRWTSDKSALNLVLENEITLIYTYEYTEIRTDFPTEYRIGNNTTSIPLEDEQAFLDVIDEYKSTIDTEKVSQEEIDAYFDSVIDLYHYDEFQYTAAVTTINVELIVEHLQVLGPNIPSIVVGTEEISFTVHALSIIQNDIWKVKFLVEEDLDGNYIAPDEALMRYFDYEPSFAE
ncbi:MAG TPA: hypothetical protein PK718_03955 [Candidatus Methanofastidiosa archaeon]|nr:hypothetical protein [Candidatus Methanofastidiosa archaeon]HPR41687.1 hypothetical protein [Candidatus Methanofastidiosa archaeon]